MGRYRNSDRTERSSRRHRQEDHDRGDSCVVDKERDHDQNEYSKRHSKRDHKDKEEREPSSRYEVKGKETSDQTKDIGDQQNVVDHQGLSTTELEARILKAKEERLLAKKAKTEDVRSDDVLTWVSRSRKIEEKKKALQFLKVFEEQDNDIVQGESEDDEDTNGHDHLAGVKVLHGLDKVMEGGAVVLTLKDQSILADHGDNVNDGVDVLENVEIGEQKQRDEAYKAAKKKTGVYDHEEYFSGADSEKKILPKYDDPVAASDHELTLDERGRFGVQAEKKLEDLRNRMQQGASSNNRLFEDLTNVSRKTASDYYSNEEMELKFKKPRNKKSFRKKEKLDINALEAEAVSAGLGAADLGSRNDVKRQASKREEQERLEAERRHNALQVAKNKADEAAKSLQLIPQHNVSVKPYTEYHGSTIVSAGYDDDEDFHKSLERVRKLAPKKKEEEDMKSDSLREIALQAIANGSQTHADGDHDESQKIKVVFTEINEFVSGPMLDEDQSNIKAESNDVFSMVEDNKEPTGNNSNDEEKRVHEVGGWLVVRHDSDQEEEKLPATAMDEAKGVKEDVPDKIIREVPIGKGLGSTLALLRERGIFKVKEDYEVKLDRTDEFGRPMTEKEAFKRFSHKFHGKVPGKGKQQKRINQYQKDLKLKQVECSDAPSQLMEWMRETQARLQTPYLVIDRKRKDKPESSGTRKKPRT